MDFEFDKKWRDLLDDLSKTQDEPLDLQSVLFLIGIQELNMGYVELSKDQKVDVMHIAICTLLEPYGHYEYVGKDKDGWPHWDVVNSLPPLKSKSQERLMKESVIAYFENDFESQNK